MKIDEFFPRCHYQFITGKNMYGVDEEFLDCKILYQTGFTVEENRELFSGNKTRAINALQELIDLLEFDKERLENDGN